jgi:hypothetical protein
MVVREAIAAHAVGFSSGHTRRGSPQLIPQAHLARQGDGLRALIRSKGVIFEQILG